MSVINASNAAICWPPLNTPNSAPVLISFMLLGGPAAMPMILALEACACSTNEDRSGVASGGRTEPSTLPPLAGVTPGGARPPGRAQGGASGGEEHAAPPPLAPAAPGAA